HRDKRPLTLAARVVGPGTDKGDGADRTARVDVVPGETAVSFEVEVPTPRLWWPHGMGEQPLYDLEVELLSAGGTRLDRWSRRIGFRDIRLETGPDEHGSAFTFVVNGEPMFARGANWIPDDCFPSRVTASRYRERLTQAKEANIDLLRVWGGG